MRSAFATAFAAGVLVGMIAKVGNTVGILTGARLGKIEGTIGPSSVVVVGTGGNVGKIDGLSIESPPGM